MIVHYQNRTKAFVAVDGTQFFYKTANELLDILNRLIPYYGSSYVMPFYYYAARFL